MTDSRPSTSLSLSIAAIYALMLAIPTILGVPSSISAGEEYPGNAVHMPLMAMIIAIAFGVSAAGLFQRKNWGRYVFLIVAPWASIALGSVFASGLWQEDVPYTAVAIFAYVPIAFLLSRGRTLRALGITNVSWVSRGGAIVTACAVIMFTIRLIVASSKPSSSGGILQQAEALNTYVQHLVLCDVPLWNYVGAFIAVSIPTRVKAADDI